MGLDELEPIFWENMEIMWFNNPIYEPPQNGQILDEQEQEEQEQE